MSRVNKKHSSFDTTKLRWLSCLQCLYLYVILQIESSAKRKGKDAKNRELFEKVFPELRKQREDRERFNRVGARIKSEADLEEIMDGLQEQEVRQWLVRGRICNWQVNITRCRNVHNSEYENIWICIYCFVKKLHLNIVCKDTSLYYVYNFESVIFFLL